MTSDVFGSVSASTPMIEICSPVDSRLLRYPADSVEDCLRSAGRAAAAFPSWSSLSPVIRAQALARLADVLEAQTPQLVASMTSELGTPSGWARHNVAFAAQILRDTGTYASRVDWTEELTDPRHRASFAKRVPAGVCFGIAPWNAPLILGVRAIAAPLLCGNTVLLKGSEFAPGTFRLLGDAIAAAGIPPEVAQVLVTRGVDSETVAEGLIANPVVRRVNFTGSTRVGRQIAEHCARHLKRPLLELGGQAAAVVLDDADLDLAAKSLLWGAYTNMGQVCMSTERLVVAESIADELIVKLETGRKALRLGDPRDAEVDLGPVITQAAADRIGGMITDAVASGANLVGGGRSRGRFVEPTIVDRVEPGMRLYNEEVFGPVLSITRVADDLEALTVVNDSEYGLSAAVFSADLDRARDFSARMFSGICHINGPTIDDNPHAPFGGLKNSGFGRFGGRWGLEEFTELRWVTRPAS